MSSWRDRLNAVPLPVLFIYYSVAFGGLTLLWPGPDASRSAGRAVVSGLCFSTLMTTWSALMRRRDRATAGTSHVTRAAPIALALRTGRAPSDRQWDTALLGLVDRRRAQLGWATRANPVVFGGFMLLSVVLAVAERSVVWVGNAVLYAGFAFWLRRSSRRSYHHLARLESELKSRRTAR
jgi:hypothetical protein